MVKTKIINLIVRNDSDINNKLINNIPNINDNIEENNFNDIKNEKIINNIGNNVNANNSNIIIGKTEKNIIKNNNLTYLETKKKRKNKEIKKDISINNCIPLNEQENKQEEKDINKEKNKNKKETKNRASSHKENISEFNNDNSNSITFLNQKRNEDNLFYEGIIHNNFLYYSFFFTEKEILRRRKRISINESFLNDNQLKLILDKVEKNLPEFRYLNQKVYLKLIYEINIESIEISNYQNIINEFYYKSYNINNLILFIKTINNKIFGGFTHIGFNLENNIENKRIDKDSFVFSINKMKIFDVEKMNETCIFCNIETLPEFKNQIYFEKNNLNYGYTGKKNKGYLVDEDYELNDKEKIFYIKQIQLIGINLLN